MIGTEPFVSQLVNLNAMADVLPADSVSSGPIPVTTCHRPASGVTLTDAGKTRASLKAVRRRDRRMSMIRRSPLRCLPNRCRGGVPTSRSDQFWRVSHRLWLGRPSPGNHFPPSRRSPGQNTPLLDPPFPMDDPYSKITNCRISPHSRFLKVRRQQR